MQVVPVVAGNHLLQRGPCFCACWPLRPAERETGLPQFRLERRYDTGLDRFRPTIILEGSETRVLVEQTTVVDPQRLGRSAGRLDATELRSVDEALSLVLGL